jgi:light-regulated signal transduction histidine kinase (bacteriophytochrome)
MLADWISTDYSDKFDQQGKEQIKLLINRATRMSKLIDGIWEYSKIVYLTEQKEKVDLNTLLTEVIYKINPPQSTKITTENKLPTIVCEKERISEIFQNLLKNAVEFMDKPEGQIKVGCVEEDNFWKFSVADNGPGIEEKHFEKIFKMLQTLAPRDEFESTGIGLTITKKIVEMYGGKIWVQSKIGEGSTFFFTISKVLSVTDNEKQLLASSR